MVSMLISSMLDCGLEPCTGQTKDYEFAICCYYARHTALRRKSKDWVGIRIMCLSRVTYLCVDDCVSELALQKCIEACWSITKQTSSSSSSHKSVTCSHLDIAEKLLIWRLSNNRPLAASIYENDIRLCRTNHIQNSF